MHPKNLFIRDYTYELPPDRIAYYPLEHRDASKLLIYKEGKIYEDVYRNIAHHIPSPALLVFNKSKVIEARLLFRKPSGGVIELFCLEPSIQYTDVATAMQQEEKVRWHCLVGGASKWKPGQVLKKNIPRDGGDLELSATYIEKQTSHFLIEFSWTPSSLSFAEILHAFGAIPLPPYIKREAEAIDTDRYQTVYAQHEGSVAAPTAGLHFTEGLLESLRTKQIDLDYVTLHVGAGTFKPVKSDTMEMHEMHGELLDVSRETIENIMAHFGEIIAVGTTSLRTLETLYWLGHRLITKNLEPTSLDQWYPYSTTEKVTVDASLHALVTWLNTNKMDRLVANTRIIIAPGYQMQMAKALITNFHQPQSTLLLLVAAAVGEDWKKIYDFALQNNYRFLSYGDGCLLWISP
jgi:S-adenosylmethionine:tRNA ribosyltransferase-isomerase